MNVPVELRYTKEHEWIKVEGDIGIIGITDFAQGELGDIVFVDLNSDLSEIKMNETFGTIEAVKTVSDLYGPIDGKILEINTKLNDEPQLINTDPYGAGWIVKVKLTNMDQLNDLFDALTYQAQIG